MSAPAFERKFDQLLPYRADRDSRTDVVAKDSIVKPAKASLDFQEGVLNQPDNERHDSSQYNCDHLHKSVTNPSGAGHVNIPDLETSIYLSRHHEVSSTFSTITSPPKPAMTAARLFIASLGNPPPYSSTRHSAGHTLIKALQSHLSLPVFSKSKSYANGLTSIGAEVGRPEYTLWQSPSLMNASGVALLKAYKTYLSTAQDSPSDPLPGLVILYDEMESAPSQLKARRGATSAKGHNGIKSVQQSLQSAGIMTKLGDRFVKIGIGIGRPAGGSRSPDDVSRYVLSQFTTDEKEGIEGKVGELERMLEQEMTRMSR